MPVLANLTPDGLLAHAGAVAPYDPADLTWAALVIGAAQAGITTALNRGPAPVLEREADLELELALVMAAAEAWKRREAPFAVLPFADLQGGAVRLARDYLDGVRPIIQRYNRVALA
jgi:hypothetical protein